MLSSKMSVLCIPTAFCTYTGEALDKKTPLLRSMRAVDEQAQPRAGAVRRAQAPRGHHASAPSRSTSSSPRDEYARRERPACSRDAPCSAGPPVQGPGASRSTTSAPSARPVNEFMKELDDELWALGIPAKTKHNEVAPAQHELAPIYHERQPRASTRTCSRWRRCACSPATTAWCAFCTRSPSRASTDPASTTTGRSAARRARTCLSPGEQPRWRTCAFLRVPHRRSSRRSTTTQELLRASAASAGNDHRLGGQRGARRRSCRSFWATSWARS